MARFSGQWAACMVQEDSVTFRFEEGVATVDLHSVRRSNVLGELVDLEGSGSSSGDEVKLCVPPGVLRAWLSCTSLITEHCSLSEALKDVSADAMAEYLKAADYLADEKTVNDLRTAMGRNLGLEVLAKSPQTGPTHQVLETLSEPLLQCVLRAAPTTLDSNLARLPAQARLTAAHAAFPGLQATGTLELDCSCHSTATCTEVLKLVSALPSSQRPTALHLEAIDLDPRPPRAAQTHIRALFRAWSAAVCSGALTDSRSWSRASATQASSCRATPTEVSIKGVRVHPNQFQQLLKPLAKCGTLQRLTISDVGIHTAEAEAFRQQLFRQKRYSQRRTVQASVLATALQCSSLASLTLHDISCGQRSTDSSYSHFLSSMWRLSKLTELKLLANESQHFIPDWAKAMASSLPRMPQLQALSFGFVRSCPEADAIALASAFSSLAVLTWLDLSGNGPVRETDESSAWPKLLPALTRLTTLKYVSLTQLKLVSGAWEHGAEPITLAIHAMPRLETVALKWDNIWTADLVLAVLDALSSAGSCTRLVLKGDVIGWFDFTTSEALDVAIARACLMPSLKHLDMQCECNSILQARHIAEQRDEFLGRLAKVQERVAAAPPTRATLPALTHLAFRLSSSAARRVFYAAFSGMPALQQLHFSCFANKDHSSCVDAEMTHLQEALCALVSSAPLQELRLQFSATPTHIDQLSAALEHFTTLTCVELCTLDEHGYGTRERRTEPPANSRAFVNLLHALSRHSGLAQLSLRDVDVLVGPGQLPDPPSDPPTEPQPVCTYAHTQPPWSGISGVFESWSQSLVALSVTGILPLSRSLSAVLQGLRSLHCLETLQLTLVAPSRWRHRESASQVANALAESLVHLTWLRTLTLGNMQLGGGGACMRTLTRALTRLPALRHVELRFPKLTFDDFEAAAALLRAHTSIRSMAAGLPGHPLRVAGLDELGQSRTGVGVEPRLIEVTQELVAAVGAARDPLRCRDLVRRIKLGARAVEYYGMHRGSSAPGGSTSLFRETVLKGPLCCFAP